MLEHSRQTGVEVIATGSRPVRYDSAWVSAEIGEVLASLRGRLSTAACRELLGDSVVAGLDAAALAMAGRLGSPLHIVVVGDFKRGKSSLINAMLGQQILSVDVLPETIAITELHHGPSFDARLFMKDGGYVPIAADELRRETLEALLATHGDHVDHLHIELPLAGQEGVVWVDTPGSGDTFRRFEDAVAAYLDRCDLVVGVLSPHSPLSLSEQTFFRQVLAPRDFPKICFVLNMLDLVRQPRDRQRLALELRNRLSRSFPGAQHFALSALDEQARQAGNPRPLPDAATELAAGFDLFRQSIEETVACQRVAIQAQRAIDLTNKLLVAITQHLDLLRAGLAARTSEVAAAVAAQGAYRSSVAQERMQREQELKDLLQRLAQQARGWLAAFVDRLLAALSAQTPTPDAGQVQRHLPFFVGDALRQAVLACAEAQMPVVHDFLSTCIEGEASGRALLAVPTTLDRGIAQATFGDLDWDSSHLFHLVAERLLLGASLLGGVFAGLDGHSGRDEWAKAIQGLRSRRSDLLAAAGKTLDSAYEKMGSALSLELNASRDEKLNAIDDALQQAQVWQAKSLTERGEQETRIKHLGAEIAAFQQALDSVRERLAFAGGPSEESETGQ